MRRSIRKAGLFCFAICMMFVVPCYAAEGSDVTQNHILFLRRKG